MKKQINQKLTVVTPIILFFWLIFIGSCRKGITRPDTGKPDTGNSKIVYTDVNPDSIIISSSTLLYNLDLNNDGVTDFVFNSKILSFNCGAYVDFGISASNSYQTTDAISIKPASDSNSVMTSGSNQLPALDSSAAIVPDSPWVTTSQLLLIGTIKRAGRCNTIFPASGNWLDVSDKYLGLKFVKGSDIYYGWAELSSTYSATNTTSPVLIVGQLTLKAYAYNSIPNQPIAAGQTQ